MKSLSAAIAITGAVYLASTVVLAITQAPLGSAMFFACAAGAGLAYVGILARLWNADAVPQRALVGCLLLAVAFRAPLVLPSVNSDSDLVRYVWDGRVQTFGYSPYQVVPSDPAVAAAHTDETRQMPSLRAPTPYPPGAQLFFRLVVSLHDSTRTMKVTLALCDLLTILVVWRWLAFTGHREWLVLAYAWNPLVILEIAHSGHLDTLGALWIAASAYWLAQRRTALSSVAFVLAVTTKLLPIVLLPLYWRRIRIRDAALGAVVFGLLYLGYTRDGVLPVGQVPSVIQHIRFNGPVFRFIGRSTTPQVAAACTVVLGLLAAVWARWRLDATDPAAWGWPMAVALAGAPVIYPWYLIYLTPFLWAISMLPVMIWTMTVLLTYVVWAIAREGGRWIVPTSIMVVEYLIPLSVAAGLLWRRFQRNKTPVLYRAEPSRTPPAVSEPRIGRESKSLFLGHDYPEHYVNQDAGKRGR